VRNKDILKISPQDFIGDGEFNRDLDWENAVSKTLEQVENFMKLSEQKKVVFERLIKFIDKPSLFKVLLRGL
jgi:hypothetical protein